MTVKNRESLLGQVEALLPNNATSDISAADVRTSIKDPIESAFMEEDLYSGRAEGDILTAAQITSDQNDYGPVTAGSPSQPTYADANIWRLSTDAERRLTGLLGGAAGRRIAIHNVGSFDLVLSHEGSGSTAANRIVTPSQSAIYIAPGGVLQLVYDGTSSRWRVFGMWGRVTLTAGFAVSPYDLGTSGGSPNLYACDPLNGNNQKISNNAAFSIAGLGRDGWVDLWITNGASAGAVTFNGMRVSSATGDALTTTAGHKFIVQLRRVDGVTTYHVKALQ